MQFVGFPSIESLHNIVKYTHTYPWSVKEPIKYRGKIKLHGTNAAVRIVDGEIGAQSRSHIITPSCDNAGFALWVEAHKDYWKSIKTPTKDITVFGEWCGRGIMKGTAINQIPKKIFAVFAIFAGDDIITDPSKIAELLVDKPDNVHILPWHKDQFTVDYCSEANIRSVAPVLNTMVADIEKCDPWVKSTFDVAGIGEGIVFYPETDKVEIFNRFVFKAKGEQHRVAHTKVAVQIAPEILQSISASVLMFVTEARMEQGLVEVGGSLEMSNIGQFIKWCMGDISKESKAELEAANLTFDHIQRPILGAVKEWFIKKGRVV